MTKTYGILITCEKHDNGDVTVTYDDVKSKNGESWSYQGIVTSYTISAEKLLEMPDYGLDNKVREKGKLPLTFGLGSNLLSLIKARLLPQVED